MDLVDTARDRRGILTLSLNRPERHNAFDDQLVAQLTERLDDAQNDPDVRLVVLTGAGDSFSAGADLNWMRRMAEAGEDENERDARALARLMRTLNFLDRPTLARINGSAFGGGVGLIACCDIAVAADHARFGVTESRLGLAPAVISPYVVRRIGAAQARRWFLTGERFDAETAERIGLVHERVEMDELDAAVERLANQVLAGGPSALRACKRLALGHGTADAETQRQQDHLNARLIAQLRVSAEGQEGLAAFLEKRQPGWRADGGQT